MIAQRQHPEKHTIYTRQRNSTDVQHYLNRNPHAVSPRFRHHMATLFHPVSAAFRQRSNTSTHHSNFGQPHHVADSGANVLTRGSFFPVLRNNRPSLKGPSLTQIMCLHDPRISAVRRYSRLHMPHCLSSLKNHLLVLQLLTPY